VDSCAYTLQFPVAIDQGIQRWAIPHSLALSASSRLAVQRQRLKGSGTAGTPARRRAAAEVAPRCNATTNRTETPLPEKRYPPKSSPWSQCFSRSYTSILPTSLGHLNSIDQRLFTSESGSGYRYGQYVREKDVQPFDGKHAPNN